MSTITNVSRQDMKQNFFQFFGKKWWVFGFLYACRIFRTHRKILQKYFRHMHVRTKIMWEHTFVFASPRLFFDSSSPNFQSCFFHLSSRAFKNRVCTRTCQKIFDFHIFHILVIPFKYQFRIYYNHRTTIPFGFVSRFGQVFCFILPCGHDLRSNSGDKI